MAKSEYDPAKDKQLREIEYVKIGERQHVEIGIWSYNGGEAKLGINRKVNTHSGTVTRAIGRMTRSEAQIIIPLLSSALLDETKWTP